MANSRFPRRSASTHRPLRHLWQAAALSLAATAACGGAGPVAESQASGSKERPFTIHEVASFSTPWAMDFIPGSGVPLTGMALLTEREGTLWLVDTATGAKQEV